MTVHISTLAERTCLLVQGAQAVEFLQGLLTQDIEGLGPDELRHAALLTPQGKLICELLVSTAAEGVRIDLDRAALAGLEQKLTLYRLRSPVSFGASEDPVIVAWGDQPSGTGWMADPRHSGLGWRRYDTPSNTGDQATGTPASDWHCLRRRLGVIDQSEAGDAEHYPVELNLDLNNGIDFHKGCFVGQETTSRMKRRGTLKSRILPIRSQAARIERGAEILNGQMRAGEVLGFDSGYGIALLRLDRLDGGLRVGEAPVEVDNPAGIPLPG